MLPLGLESVTVTPGRTASELSAMVPPIAPTPCADAGSVADAQNNSTATDLFTTLFALMVNLSSSSTADRAFCRAREYTQGSILDSPLLSCDRFGVRAPCRASVGTFFG